MHATIDYSPNPSAPEKMTLYLTEENLRTASESQIERFVRVWVKDRSQYAPNLKELTLILEPTEDTCSGIQRFLEYCQRFPNTGTKITVLSTV